MTAKGQPDTNFGRVGYPGGESDPPTLTAGAQAPLVDQFGRLIVVVDGLVNTTGGGVSGGGSPANELANDASAPINVSDAAAPRSGQSLTINPTLDSASWQSVGISYQTGINPDTNRWVLAANNTTHMLPVPIETGERVGIYVGVSTTNASVDCSDATIFINRTSSSAAMPLRPGGWYEWTSIVVGETKQWVPSGGSGHEAKAPIEYAAAAAVEVRPNQWVLSGDVGGVVNAPSNPVNGDCFGVFVTTGSANATVVPATGQSIATHDGLQIITAPSNLAVPGWGYYEWIWIASQSVWRPRENVYTSGSASIKYKVRTVATSSITLSGTQTVSGVGVLVGDRVLVTANAPASNNGPWVVSAGAWFRPSDFDISSKVKGGCLIVCDEGTLADTLWMLSTNDPITLGTTSLAFIQVGGPKASTLPRDVGDPGVGATFGTTIRWAIEDHVHQIQSLHPGNNGFRINNVNTGTIPVDGSSSTVYLLPHTGNRMSLTNNGINFYPCTPSANPSIAVTGQTAGIPCDVFAVFGSLTAISLELVPWSTASARATGLFQLNGVWVKSGQNTKRYVGTILPDSATTYTVRTLGTAGTKAVAGIWNQDNRVKSTYLWQPTFDTWSPVAANTWEPLGGGSGPHIEYVLGQTLDSISADAISAFSSTPAAAAAIGIGLDSTTTPSGFRHSATAQSASVAGLVAKASQRLPSIGRKTVNLLAFSNLNTSLFYGQSGAMQAGLTFDIWG